MALTQVAFHGFCPLFVLTSALMMTSCALLGILGIVWSCTRGCAALVVLSLGLLGDLMLFGGFVSCLLWFVLSAAVIYLYFVFLPSQYAEKEGENGKGGGAPWWLQDLGSFQVSTHLDTVHLFLYLSLSVCVCICQVSTHLHTVNLSPRAPHLFLLLALLLALPGLLSLCSFAPLPPLSSYATPSARSHPCVCECKRALWREKEDEGRKIGRGLCVVSLSLECVCLSITAFFLQSLSLSWS
jgi:hypothetical protein